MLSLREATPQAERSMRRVELLVKQRLDGLLQGEHLGRLPGPGSEPNDGRTYQPGDDVRRIDWSLSARSQQIQVRDTIADRELETWIVVDGSPSMDFGTDQWTKRELAAAVVAAYGFASTSFGSRVGMVVATPDGAHVVPAASGDIAVRRAVRALEARAPADGGGADLANAIERIGRLRRRPGLLVLVSDLLGDDAWVRPLRTWSVRSRTDVVEVRDPREDALPPVGLLTVVDPETGRLREVQTADRRVRSAFAAAASAQRTAHRAAARASGAHHVVVNTDRDWIADLVRHLLTVRRHPR